MDKVQESEQANKQWHNEMPKFAPNSRDDEKQKKGEKDLTVRRKTSQLRNLRSK